MRIAIDARELAGRPTGVGRYLAEILREWAGMPEARRHAYILCAESPPAWHDGLSVTHATASGSGAVWEQLTLPRLARAAHADVLFCPAYSGPVFTGIPLVTAVHDVSFAAHPEWFRWREGLRRRLLTRASARRAARVLTLTRFSKQEIVDHLGVPPDRIEVVYPGVTVRGRGPASVAGAADPALRAQTGEPLVLYVGSIFNRRHVPETIRGFERLARRHPAARLAIVGDNRTFPHVELEPLVRDPARVRIVRYVDDPVLDELYGRAGAFVFLSEYEGFGLTPLEALAAGVPAVVLDTPVAREVYGDAVRYVAEPAPRQIEAALEAVLFDSVVREQLMQAAATVVSRYSWTECARRVLDALTAAA
jgi:glycosyltransferase involved in cell wall biosynthesis